MEIKNSMQSLHLSQAAVYHLQQLATLVRRQTGVRHQLSDLRSTINLLRYSCTASDMTIYDIYNQFTNTLDDDQRQYLQGRGLLMQPMAFSIADNLENLGLSGITTR